MNVFSLQNKIFSAILACFISLSFILAPVSTYLEVKRAEAQIPVTDIANLIETVWNTIQTTISAASDLVQEYFASSAWQKEYVLDSIAWGLANAVIKEMIKATTRWVNSGFQGKPAFVQDMNKFLTNIADQAAGSFIFGNKQLQFLCSPFSLDIKLALSTQYQQTRDFKPQCTLTGVIDNVENMGKFFKGDFLQGGWKGWYTMTMEAQNNPYGALLESQGALTLQIAGDQNKKVELLRFGSGFLSKEYCFSEGDDERCVISTPGTIIQDQLNRTLGFPGDRLVIADELNELIGAVFSQLVSRMLEGAGGLLGLTESGYGEGSGGYFGELDNERDPSDPNVNLDILFNQLIEKETSYKTLVEDLISKLEEAENYKDETYGDENTCASGALTPSLKAALDKARADLADANTIITKTEEFKSDFILLNGTSTPQNILNALLVKYSASTTVQAKGKLMNLFNTFKSSASLHDASEIAILERQTIPDIEEEIEEFIEDIDNACEGTGFLGSQASADCPANFRAPADLKTHQLLGTGQLTYPVLRSEQVIAIPLPRLPANMASAQAGFSETPTVASPDPNPLLMTISKCKGFIDRTRNNPCNLESTNRHLNTLNWVAKFSARIPNLAAARATNYCVALESEGQWYLNASWKYDGCAFGLSECGYIATWHPGGY